jgi:hypothetical protein
MRFHVLKSSALFLVLAPVVSNAATSTTTVSSTFYVTPTGVSPGGSTTNGKFSYLGGSAATADVGPSFVVEEFSGSAILSSLDAANGTPATPVSSLSGVTLNLYDGNEPPPQYSQYATSVAGGIAFEFANASVPLSLQAASPTFDTTAAGGAGGLDTQLGSLASLGTANYVPAVNDTNLAYALSGTTGYTDLLNAINSGSNFYIAVEATSTTTTAAFGGQYGSAYGPTSQNGFAATPTITVSGAVPEPASLGLLGMSGLFLLGRRRQVVSV